jgi:ketosteroid isomerase-like protein
MPSPTPSEFSRLFESYFNSGDLESLVDLYEAEAILLPEPGKPVSGYAAIRSALEAFIATGFKIYLKTHSIHEAGGVALLYSKWSLSDGQGGAPAMGGSTVEVVRKQTDGSWRFIIDDPYGGAMG